MSRVALTALLFAAACALGCSEGGPYTGVLDLTAGSTSTDLAMAPSPSMDLTPADLLGPDCGTLVKCALTCLGGLAGGGTGGGANPLTCLQSCGGGAQPAALQEAGALVICAAQNCLAGLGADGGGGTVGALQCVAQACPSQVAACPGLLSF